MVVNEQGIRGAEFERSVSEYGIAPCVIEARGPRVRLTPRLPDLLPLGQTLRVPTLTNDEPRIICAFPLLVTRPCLLTISSGRAHLYKRVYPIITPIICSLSLPHDSLRWSSTRSYAGDVHPHAPHHPRFPAEPITPSNGRSLPRLIIRNNGKISSPRTQYHPPRAGS